MTLAEEHTIKISHAILAMLAIIVAFLMGIISLTWDASARLQQMDDKITQMQIEQVQEKNDMQAVKALLWTPVVGTKQGRH